MNETMSQRDTEKKHTCLQCGTAFSRPYRLKQHEKIHLNIKEFVCGESNCNKSYTNKSHLDRHIQSAHIDKTFNVIYSCPECRKVYVNRQNLKRHIKVVHSRKAWFNCDVCSCSFKKKHQLSAHMYQHTFVKSFSCELCSSEFITITDKRKHMKQHKTYSCEFCDMAFVQWSKYWKHKKKEHTEFICDDCGRRFYKRVHMVRHSRMHNTSHIQTFYTCTYDNCERVYTRNSNLKQHIKMKHLEIMHDCEICGAKLSTKAKLALHLSTHSKPKKCSKATKSSRQVRCDKGAPKVSTALRIAGLIFDPEDTNIKGTLKASTGCDKLKMKKGENAKDILITTTDHVKPINEDKNIKETLNGHVEPKIQEDVNTKGTLNGHVEPKIKDVNTKGTLNRHIEAKIKDVNTKGTLNGHVEPKFKEDENTNVTLATGHIEPEIEISDIINSIELKNTTVMC